LLKGESQIGSCVEIEICLLALNSIVKQIVVHGEIGDCLEFGSCNLEIIYE